VLSQQSDDDAERGCVGAGADFDAVAAGQVDVDRRGRRADACGVDDGETDWLFVCTGAQSTAPRVEGMLGERVLAAIVAYRLSARGLVGDVFCPKLQALVGAGVGFHAQLFAAVWAWFKRGSRDAYGYPACAREPELARRVNVSGIRALESVRARSQAVLFASTGSVYGSQKEVCTEDSPLEPLTLYAETKVQAEGLLLGAGNAVVLRLATAFGLSYLQRFDLLVNYLAYLGATARALDVYEPHFVGDHLKT